MYNGWSNYETWAVKLWLDNDEGTQVEMSDSAKRATLMWNPERWLSDYIKDFVNDGVPNIPASMYLDLLTSAIANVDFSEIAKAYMEDIEEDNSCDQCGAAMINGTYCHETECPNMGMVKVDGEWVDQDEVNQ
jgi:hypothetical protein